MPSPSTNGYLFLGTLAGLEALTVKYWINGRIYNVSRVDSGVLIIVVVVIRVTEAVYALHIAVPASLPDPGARLGLYR